jgi:hypothetical protein
MTKLRHNDEEVRFGYGEAGLECCVGYDLAGSDTACVFVEEIDEDEYGTGVSQSEDEEDEDQDDVSDDGYQ